jgi:hypothetical protein
LATGWSPDDDLGGADELTDAELDQMIDLKLCNHDPCSLSECSSCSEESDDLSANLEDDLDDRLTFPRGAGGGGDDDDDHAEDEDDEDEDDDGQDDVDRAVKQRLTKSVRDHHQQRHLHHRRRRMRHELKKAKLEAAARGDAGGDDEIRAALNDEEMVRLGSYTPVERQRKIQRYMEKRRRRVWSKKILYSCRKNFADRRPRIGGRFVKIHGDGAEGAGGAGAANAGDSLSTSPALSGLHTPLGLHAALTQHMHGALGLPGGHPLLTAFSLPLAHYAHTAYTQPGFGAAAAAAAAASPGGTGGAAGGSGSSLGVLSFLKQEAPSAASAAAASPSGLSAALRAPNGLANQSSPPPPTQNSPQAPKTNAA